MIHGGDIYSQEIEYDFSVNLNPLDCNEIIEQIMNSGRLVAGNYPDCQQRLFREAVAKIEGVDAKEVIGGNGASELLFALFNMLKPKRVMLPAPGFAGYRHAAASLDNCEIVCHSISEEKGFVICDDFLQMLEMEAEEGLDMLILNNPNNPTGRIIPKDILLKAYGICKEKGIKLVVDECFLKMSDGGYSMIAHINDYDGLFVVNAFTKLFAIPGIRAGYVVSAMSNIEALMRFLPEWNLSVIAQTAGVICCNILESQNFEESSLKVIRTERDYLVKELKKLGIVVYESETSYVLVYSQTDIYEYLKSRKILIRDCSDYDGLSKGFYRIAVKSHSENEILVETLRRGNS